MLKIFDNLFLLLELSIPALKIKLLLIFKSYQLIFFFSKLELYLLIIHHVYLILFLLNFVIYHFSLHLIEFGLKAIVQTTYLKNLIVFLF